MLKILLASHGNLCLGMLATRWVWYARVARNLTKGEREKNAVLASIMSGSGRFKVIAQRSYRHLLSGAYGVFSEEHEHIMRLGIPFDNNWLQANAYVTQPNGAAYEFRHDENSIVSWRE